MRYVYLCGAIEQVHSTFARQWRRKSKELLREFTTLIAVDPLDYEEEDRVTADAEIVNRDRYLVDRADALLVDGRQASWGSAMEVGWAFADSKPIIVWGRRREDCPTFLRHHATAVYTTLEEAVLDGLAPLGMPPV